MTDTYTFHCKWSEEDKAYVGTFDNMPSLSWVGRTKGDALSGVAKLVVCCEEDIESEGREIPVTAEIEYLRAQFDVVYTQLDHLAEDVHEIRQLLTRLESHVAKMIAWREKNIEAEERNVDKH